jgi:hypothetical protein
MAAALCVGSTGNVRFPLPNACIIDVEFGDEASGSALPHQPQRNNLWFFICTKKLQEKSYQMYV